MKTLSQNRCERLKVALFLVFLIPFLGLIVAGLMHRLGPNPPETLAHTSGVWALRFLFITLTISPLRWLTGWLWPARLRRMVALFGFFYACIHVLVYLLFDQSFDWAEIAKDIVNRPYILAGFASFVMMIPLALTSTNSMMKRMGGRNWQLLHRLTYPCAIAAVLHFFWLVKQDISHPSVYALILIGLFCVRLIKRPRTRYKPVMEPRVFPYSRN